jgi:uncharacterized protein (DUF58 family)
MEPERSTQGIWIMAAFLGSAAIVLDSPPFFLATFSLVLFSASLAIRFRLRMHRIITSARVTRSSDHKVLQQGGITDITTGFSCSPDPGLTIRVRDVSPPATLSDPVNATAVVAADGSAAVRYSLTPLVPGSIRFPGISLTVSDPFFSASLVMGSGPFCGPELDVHPHAAYERSHVREGFGPKEKDAFSIFRGYGIRSVREYIRGDDLRFIDWKMTAKHDRMFVREYTAVENFPPLIVLDLPDRSFPVPDALIAGLVNDVTGETVNAIRNYGSVSLFIISGVNIISIMLEETDLQRCITVLRTSAHPHFRLHHAYRWKDRAGMRGFYRKTGGAADWQEKDESGLFLARIAQIYHASLAVPYVPAFSTQVSRLLHSLQIEEIQIYSLFEGDLSHIREIALQAQIQRIRLKPKTVPGQDAAHIVSIRRALGTDTVEVIP